MTQGLDRFRFKHFFDGYNASIFEFGELLVWEAIAQIEKQLLAIPAKSPKKLKPRTNIMSIMIFFYTYVRTQLLY